MDQEIANTLAALERKLGELERELGSIGQREAAGAAGARTGERGHGDARLEDAGQGEARPGGANLDYAHPHTAAVPGVLVDEAAEQRFSMEVRETAYGEIPAAKDERRAIDLADLVRFKEKMQQTLEALIEEYSRLLSLKPPPDA